MGDWRAELCRRSYECFRAHDYEGIAELYHPDCEFDMGDMSAATGHRVYRGRDGVVALMKEINQVVPDWEPRVAEMRLRADGALLVRGTGEGTAGRMGVHLDIPAFGQVGEFRDGLILSFRQVEFPPKGWEDAKPVS